MEFRVIGININTESPQIKNDSNVETLGYSKEFLENDDYKHLDLRLHIFEGDYKPTKDFSHLVELLQAILDDVNIYGDNEKNFEIVKNNYFDVNPVSETGTKSCMIPYHELKRVLINELYPKRRDNEPIYLGVEALGWLWL